MTKRTSGDMKSDASPLRSPAVQDRMGWFDHKYTQLPNEADFAR